MTNYGQSNREVVQNTNEGRVDPPVTEQATVTGGGARRLHDPNVGQQNRLATALVDTAGQFGQMAVAEKHRNERIEGAKLVADGKAEEYINATEPTFAEKLFGNKPKMRVAQEMQVAQEVNRLDDQMRDWIEQTGHKEDSQAFQDQYDELYNETAGKYNDDPMKDLIAATYSQNLETTRREHAKAKNLFDQQHLLDTTMKGWADSSVKATRDLNSDDAQTRDEAIGKLQTALAKPEAMSDSAYRDGAFKTAMDDLTKGMTESTAIFEDDGVFDDLTYEQQQALQGMKEIHQIKNDSEFNSKLQQLQSFVASGNSAGAEALAKELQLENPRAVDSINAIVNQANAVATANAKAIAENQVDRQDNLEHYKNGRLNLLSPEQQYQASQDLDHALKTDAVTLDRQKYIAEGDTVYPEGHVLAGVPLGDANAPPSDAELNSASELPSYRTSKHQHWARHGGGNDPYVTGLTNTVDQLLRMPADQLAQNPEMEDQLRTGIEELNALASLPGAAQQFKQSFDSPEAYDKYKRVSMDMQAGDNLTNSLNREAAAQQRIDDGIPNPVRSERQQGRDVKAITSEFKKEHQDRSLLKLGMRQNIDNSEALDARAKHLYDGNLALFNGDHQKAMNQTSWQLNNVDATIGNKHVINGAAHNDRQEELTPGHDVESVAGLYLTTPEVKQRLRESGVDVDNLVSFGREDIRQIRPRLNVNGVQNAGMDVNVVGDNLMLTLPARGGKQDTVMVPIMDQDQVNQLSSTSDNVKKSLGDAYEGAWDIGFKAQEIAYKDDEAAKLQIQYERERRAKHGSRTGEAVRGVREDLSTGIGEKKASIGNRLKSMAGAAPEVVRLAAQDINDWMYPQELVTTKSERDYVSPRAEEAKAWSIEKQKEHLDKRDIEIEKWNKKLAELRGE